MRNMVILMALLLSSYWGLAQSGTTSVTMGQEFSELAAHGGLSGKGFAAYQSYSSNQVNGSQFFLPDWMTGEMLTSHNEVFNDDLRFLYDKVRQELFVRKKDADLIVTANKDEIQTFRLMDANGNSSYFVNSKLYTNDKPEVFYQVLAGNNSGVSLLKYIKTAFVKADATDLMKINQGEVYDAFVDKNYYYLANRGKDFAEVQLKTKSLKKVNADLNLHAEKYLEDHPQPVNEEYLIDMVKTLNESPQSK